jgi:hypothetical protein
MAFQLPDFPILNAKQMGVSDLAGSLAQGLQLGFMPRELQANLGLKKAEANSKNAYAALMGPQFIAKIVASPAFAALSPTQRANAIDTLIQVQSGSNIGNDQSLAGQSVAQATPDTNSGYSNNGESKNESALPDGENTISNNENNVGGIQPVNDVAKNMFNYYQNKEAGKTSGEVREQNLGKATMAASDASANAQTLVNQLDRFHEIYNNSILKGKALGWAADWGPEANQMSSLASAMQTTLAAQLFGSKTSNYKEALAGRVKLNASLNPETEKKNYEQLRAESNRASGMDDFYQAAQDLGIRDPSKIKNLWHSYNADVPFYDFKNNRPLENVPDNDQVLFSEYIRHKLSGNSVKQKQNNNKIENSNDPLGWR